MKSERIKTKRIQPKVGDIVAIPVVESVEYSSDFVGLWLPKPQDRVSLAQITAISATSKSNLLLLIFEGFYTYEDSLNIKDISSLTPQYHINMIGEEIRLGNFNIIKNMQIQNDTPFLLYKDIADNWVNLLPFWDIKSQYYNKPIPSIIPRTRMFTGGAIEFELLKLINNKTSPTFDEFLITPEKLLAKYFPKAKNNPKWIFDYYKANLR